MELTNSKRILNAASWVSVKLAPQDRERLGQRPSGAFQKAALLRAINFDTETIDRVAHAHLETAQRTPALRQAFALARQAAQPNFSHRDLASGAALIPADTLIDFARLFPADRRSNSFDLLLDMFERQQQVSPIGWLYLERIEMYPIGVERGEMVFTVPLAPGETQTLSHKEWSTSSRSYEHIVQDFFEEYSERGVAEKTDASMSTDNESRRSNALNFGATLSGGYGPVSLTTTFGLQSTKDERESVKQTIQRNREVTEKASARARQEHKISVKLEEKKGVEDSSFKTITNDSDDAVRIDYYRMMRKWRTDLYRYGLRLTYDITIPTPGARFWARWQRLRRLEEEIRRPFAFAIQPSAVTESNWHTLAAQYGVNLEPPPDSTITLNINRVMEEDTWGDPMFEFVAPPGYEMGPGVAGTISYWGPAGYPVLYISPSYTSTQASGGSGSGVYDVAVNTPAGGERVTVTMIRGSKYRLIIALHAGAKRRADVYESWRLRAWAMLRDAALAAHQAQTERLIGERDRLYAALTGKDTLSLRQLEREEIVRLVMLWLLGPGSWYSNSPTEVDSTLRAILSNESSLMMGSMGPSDSPTFNGIDSNEWSRALLFGDIVRYIHQAIEWENVLYFLYPYYWGSETQGRDKLLFEHADPEHRKFLRSGYARVVVTVRPGFEKDFVQLMETGTLSEQAATQYLTVAQEIQNAAMTNYAGIPPANPEKHSRPQLYPQQRKTWEIMQKVILAIEEYHRVNGRYPDTLGDLPSGTATKDAWGNDLVYRMPGSGNDYDLVSYGADGEEGGTDVNADISSAAGASLMASWFDYTPTSGIDVIVGTPPEDFA